MRPDWTLPSIFFRVNWHPVPSCVITSWPLSAYVFSWCTKMIALLPRSLVPGYSPRMAHHPLGFLSFPSPRHTWRLHFILFLEGSFPRQQGKLQLFSFCMPTCIAEGIAPLPHAEATNVLSGSATCSSAPAPNESSSAYAPTCNLCSMDTPMLLHATTPS